MAALVRDRPAQPVSSGRGTGCSAARRRDAGAHARGLEKRGAIHGELDGGALTHRRARAPASKPRWRRPVHSAGPPWPAAVASFSWREKTERRMSLGFAGDAASPSFVPAKRALGRPILIVGDGRLGTAAGERASFGPRGARRRAGLAAWPLAVGPKARASRAPSGLGRFRDWATSTVKLYIVFFYFPEAF